MIHRFHCECGAAFDVDERVIGRHVTCANCKNRTLIDAAILQPIRFYRLACDCGVTFRVEEKAVGGTFQCPACRSTVRIDRERFDETLIEVDRVSKSPRSTIEVEFDA
ncbi:MAG TPA: hypothetical protein VMY37_36000 [Thermoguttaceae bacterium]|nr:hypothetical protein [Thermoguttaceae bacterium]